MERLISTLVFILTFSMTFSQIEKEISNLFEERENRPGAIIGVFEEGKIKYQKSFGLANLDYNIPIMTKTVFDVGSVAKQFTAACIFLLEQKGKLSLDDPIQNYLPEMPVYHKETVTIRHLINHTSGLRDYVEITAYAGTPFENIFTEEMGLDIMIRQKERNFTPGKQFMYNNGGYLLLAIIIRRVTGESIGTFAHKNIFEPLGMKSTFILENSNRVVKNSATGYTKVNDNTYQKKHFYNIALGGDGQLYTTLEDLLLWDNNFYNKKIGGQALFDQQHKKGILNTGETIEYGGGLFIQHHKGQRVVQHTGSWGGFRSVFYRFPDLRKSLVIMANCSDFATVGEFLALIDLMVPKEKTKEKSEEIISSNTIPKLSKRRLQKFTGLFEVKGQPHLRLLSSIKKDTLMITQLWDKQSYKMIPSSNNTFYRKDFHLVRFVFDKKTGIPIIHERVEVWQTKKVKAYRSTLNIEEFTGEFHSSEVGTSYTIEAFENELVVYRDKQKIETLLPVSKDVFGNNFKGFQFTRKEGEINGFLIQDRRVMNLRFTKKE